VTTLRTEWARLHSWWHPRDTFVEPAGWSLRHRAAGVPEPLSLIGPRFAYLGVDGRRPGLRRVCYRPRVGQAATAKVNSIGEAHRIATDVGVSLSMDYWLANAYNARKAANLMPQHFTVWTIDQIDEVVDQAPLPADLRFNRNTGWIELPTVG
jgi:hypothetical protein